jgi:putative transposase
MDQGFRRGRHSVSRLTMHLVCVTKYRRKVLDGDAIERLRGHVGRICEGLGAELLALDGEADHIHALIEYPPKHSVSLLVNAIKGASSRRLRAERPDIAERYRQDVLWSPSYFAASTGGATLDAVRRYVDQQRASSSP